MKAGHLKKQKKTEKARPATKRTTIVPTGLHAIADSRLSFWLVFILATAATVIYYPNHFGDFDIWWHIRLGEQFISNMSWTVDHSQFSWTPTDNSWEYVTWIGSSLLYLVHKAGGYAALHLLQYLILAGMALLLFLYSRLKDEKFNVIHGAALLLAWSAMNPTAIFIKPEQFTILFFSLMVFLYFAGKTKYPKLFYCYPPLFLIWVNTHGAFLIGLFFISLIFALETVDRFFLKKNPMSPSQWNIFLTSVAFSYIMTFINPFGPTYVTDAIFRMASGGGGDIAQLTAYINRWQYLFPELYVFRRTNTAWALVIMEVGVLILFLRDFLERRRVDLTLLTANVIFFLFAMKMARAVLYFPPLWLFIVHTLTVDEKPGTFRDICRLSAIAFTLAALILIGYNTAFQNIYNSWFGSQETEFTPKKTSAMLLEQKLPGPIFNDYLIGGYLMYSLYPDYKVFIDPRHRPYESTGVWEDFMMLRAKRSMKVFEAFTQKYPFKTAILHNLKYGDLVTMFMRSDNWCLVGLDTVSALFVHKSVYDTLDQELVKRNVDPANFSGVTLPSFLSNAFRVYIDYDIDMARSIYSLYEKNVSSSYKRKDETLGLMRQAIEETVNRK